MRAKPDPYDAIMRRGHRVHRPAFTVYALPTRTVLPPRLVVGQKVDKRATVRNKLRRRLRQILRTASLSNLGLVVVARQPMAGLSYPELKTQLTRALTQL